MQLSLSTEGVPASEQFDYWRETVCRHFYVFSPGSAEFRQGYPAYLSAAQFGEFGVVDFLQPAHDWTRLKPEIATSDDGTYVIVGTSPGGGALVRVNDEEELIMHTGNLGISGSDTRLQVRHLGRGAHCLFKFPKPLLDAMLPPRARGRLPLSMISGSEGLGAVIMAYFDTLMRELPRLDPAATEAALRHLVGLMGLQQADFAGKATEFGTESGRAALRAAKLAEARRFVERHLADPGLDPARAAAALRISVRQLSLLFEPAGESFTRYVTRRRLERARALLAGPGEAGRKMADIAYACGFDSLATFYRAFRRAYGVAPGELRGNAIPEEA